MLPFLTPSSVSAAIGNINAQHDRTILFALVRCLDNSKDPRLDGRFTLNATGSDVRQNNMQGIIASGNFNDVAAVGFEIDGSDGNAACDGISLVRAMRAIDRQPKWFFNQFYDLSNLQERSDGSGHGYPYREGVTFESVLAKIRSQMNSRDLNIGNPERLRRLAGAFWLCAERAPDPPDRPTATIGGKKYQLRANAPDKISVGYDIKPGDGGDGKYGCNTLLNWSNKSQMAQALSSNPKGSTPSERGGGGGAAADPDDEQGCGAGANFALAWIVCPLIEAARDTSNTFFSKILQPLLRKAPISTEQGQNGYPSYQAWQSFRILANIILVGAMLILVYGMIRGGGGR